MRLHNYLVDYRERHVEVDHLAADMIVFQQDLLKSNTIPVQTGNDLGRPQGNITSEDRLNRVEGTRLREQLSQKFQYHSFFLGRCISRSWNFWDNCSLNLVPSTLFSLSSLVILP